MSGSPIKRSLPPKSYIYLGEKIIKLKNRFVNRTLSLKPRNDSHCLQESNTTTCINKLKPCSYSVLSKQRHMLKTQRLTASTQSVFIPSAQNIPTFQSYCRLMDKEYWEGSDENHRSGDGYERGQSYTNPTIAVSSVIVGATLSASEKAVDEEETANISNEEIEGTVKYLNDMLDEYNGCKMESSMQQHSPDDRNDWVKEWVGPSMTIWSRPIPGKDFREYKIYGRYDDIPAVAFFYIQSDIKHRKQWDKSTDVVMPLTKWENFSSTEIVYWRVLLTRFMSKRDYVYARRLTVDIDKNFMVLLNKAVNYKSKPEEKKYVRVTDYNTKMLVKPHHTYSENGFDFMMTYYDDTKTNMPSIAIKQTVKKCLPPFLELVHKGSASLWRRYQNHDFSSTDGNEADSQVAGLHEMIVEAVGNTEKAKAAAAAEAMRRDIELKRQEYLMKRTQTSEQEADTEKTTNETKTADRSKNISRRVPIRKISPPKYLPDWRKYVRMVVDERRFYPVPMMLVHPDRSDREVESICQGTDENGNQFIHSETESCTNCRHTQINSKSNKPIICLQCSGQTQQSAVSGYRECSVQDMHET